MLCGTEKYQLTLQKRGKLYFPPRCKGYSTHSTLYALSTLIRNNSQDDVLPIASIVKIDEIQELINAEKAKRYGHFKILTTTWELL